MQFSEKLKKLRAEKGVSQSELAEKIYVSRSAVAKWENGLGLPSGESLALLAEFFGVEKSELLSDVETANVIVNKNNTLSKQKLWIIVLIALSCALIVVAAVLIPLALKNPQINPSVNSVYIKELIFETEKGITDLDAKNYSDERISTDKYFAPSRIFTYNSRTTTIILPKIMVKYTIGNKISFADLKDEIECTVSENCTVRYNDKTKHVYVLATDAPYSATNEYCVNLAVGDMRLSLKIRQESIKVENIDLELQSALYNQVEADSITEIVARVTPNDATYQAMRYSIDRVVKPDGTPYPGTYTQYANLLIEDKVYLRTTAKIDVGAKIYIYAIAEKDQVRSEMLEVEIRRVRIKYISLESNNQTDKATIGETFWIRPVAHDDDATFNVKGEKFEVTLKTPELAEIEYSKGINTYFITPTSNLEKVGSVIEIYVTTPEGLSKSFYWTLESIAIKGVVLVNADTGKEFDQTFTVAKGSTIHLAMKILPDNAQYTLRQFKGTVFDSDYCTTYQTDKVLTVTVAEDAPGGSYETFYANITVTYYPFKVVNSKVYRMVVEKTPVESVVLKSDTDVLIKGKTRAALSYEIFPANADVEDIKIYNIENATGINLNFSVPDDSYLIWADYRAAGGTQVNVKMVCEGVESNTVTFTVQKIPVTSVLLGMETFRPVVSKLYPLRILYDLGADVESVDYKLLDQADGVRLIRDIFTFPYDAYIYINPNEATVGTKFRIQATVDGVESNILSLEISDGAEPEDIIELEKDVIYDLDEMYYPDAKGSVMFILLDDISENEIILVNSYYYDSFEDFNILTIFSAARSGMVFRVMAIVDGVADRIFTFKVA